MRASAQTLSYEVFLVSPDGRGGAGGVIQYDRLCQQPGASVERYPQFFGFVTFAIAGVAVCHRHPFDQRKRSRNWPMVTH
ncbi:hypothetical protein [Klebsiella pneumoniae]|uniref:hypothetical protein n=1 Tax=Klebsiella pneumoniae TaxID=573 RepID=UPI0039757BA1